MNNASLINLSRTQAILHTLNPRIAYCVWPRNSGKSSAGIATRLIILMEAMPGAQVILYSDTFERINDVIIPAIFAFLENEVGLVEGEDYVKYKRPPVHWSKPIVPLDKFDKVISFRSGFCLCLASQKVSGSANGFSAYGLIVDETKFIREEKINTEVLPAVRGNIAGRKRFGHLPEYCSKWYFSDKYGGEIKWILKKKTKMNTEHCNAVMKLQENILVLQQKLEEHTSPATQTKYKHQIEELKEAADKIRCKLVFFSDPQPYDNMSIAGKQYFKDQKRDLSELEYEIAILNYNPDRVINSFYPKFDSTRHCHRYMNDTVDHLPIMVAMDYQWRITPLVAAQLSNLPDSRFTSLNFLAGIHTLHPKGGIKQTVDAFCDHFINHSCKIVQYYFDHTAVAKRPDGKSFYELAIEQFNHRGWQVKEMYLGKAAEHNDRYKAFHFHFEKSADFSISFNEVNCEYLIKSVRFAGAKTVGKKTFKDKSKEKNLNYPAEEQTDYSEAMDMVIYGTLEMDMIDQKPHYTDTGVYIPV